jgi:hypothetical protein
MGSLLRLPFQFSQGASVADVDPDEQSDIRDFPSHPACRFAHAGYMLPRV